jgi:hypothetical protein
MHLAAGSLYRSKRVPFGITDRIKGKLKEKKTGGPKRDQIGKKRNN